MEKVILRKTLKCGSQLYLAGTILTEPFPGGIIQELKAGSGIVEIVEEPRVQRLSWRWPCAYCEEGFSRKTDLAGHIKETHHAPFKVFGQEFALPSNKQQ